MEPKRPKFQSPSMQSLLTGPLASIQLQTPNLVEGPWHDTPHPTRLWYLWRRKHLFWRKQAGNFCKSPGQGNSVWIVVNSMIPSQPLKQKTFKKVIFKSGKEHPNFFDTIAWGRQTYVQMLCNQLQISNWRTNYFPTQDTRRCLPTSMASYHKSHGFLFPNSEAWSDEVCHQTMSLPWCWVLRWC